MEPSNKTGRDAWRPSQTLKLRSQSGPLSPPFRGPAPIRRAISLAFGFLLICVATFIFWSLWRDPKERHLHGELAFLAGGVIFLLALAGVSHRIRRPKRDDRSVLKL